jgi:hypothetical protein
LPRPDHLAHERRRLGKHQFGTYSIIYKVIAIIIIMIDNNNELLH